jgi:sulfite exporter TauE/SafE
MFIKPIRKVPRIVVYIIIGALLGALGGWVFS